MSDARRKPFFANITAIAGFLLIVLVAYAFSYAPLIKLVAEPGEIIFDGSDLPVYRPVDWLIDATPLRQPLFWWADVWHEDDRFRLAHTVRAVPHSFLWD